MEVFYALYINFHSFNQISCIKHPLQAALNGIALMNDIAEWFISCLVAVLKMLSSCAYNFKYVHIYDRSVWDNANFRESVITDVSTQACSLFSQICFTLFHQVRFPVLSSAAACSSSVYVTVLDFDSLRTGILSVCLGILVSP